MEGNSGGGRRANGLGGSKVGVIFGSSSASEGVISSTIALRLRIEIARARPPEMVLAFHGVFVNASVVQDVGIEGVTIHHVLYHLLAMGVSHQRLLDVRQVFPKVLRRLLRQQVRTCRSSRNRGQRRARSKLRVPRRCLGRLAYALCGRAVCLLGFFEYYLVFLNMMLLFTVLIFVLNDIQMAL